MGTEEKDGPNSAQHTRELKEQCSSMGSFEAKDVHLVQVIVVSYKSFFGFTAFSKMKVKSKEPSNNYAEEDRPLSHQG